MTSKVHLVIWLSYDCHCPHLSTTAASDAPSAPSAPLAASWLSPQAKTVPLLDNAKVEFLAERFIVQWPWEDHGKIIGDHCLMILMYNVCMYFYIYILYIYTYYIYCIVNVEFIFNPHWTESLIRCSRFTQICEAAEGPYLTTRIWTICSLVNASTSPLMDSPCFLGLRHQDINFQDHEWYQDEFHVSKF